jgi:hypothetical protein
MTSPALADARPSYVPPGYSLALELIGASAVGLGRSPDQRVLIYRQGAALDDAVHSLAIYVAPAGTAEALGGTEHREGRPVELPGTSARAVYHNGMWAPGPGPEQRESGPLVLHWNSAVAHSLTVFGTNLVFGIRGAKTRGVSFSELVRIAQSLPLDR